MSTRLPPLSSVDAGLPLLLLLLMTMEDLFTTALRAVLLPPVCKR